MKQLVDNGETQLNKHGRLLALKSLENAINAVEPRRLIRARISLKESILHADGCQFDIKEFRNIYVLGGGKAGSSMAEALEEILGDHITCGIVNVPKGSKHKTRVVKIHEASHPTPDESGVEGTAQMLEIAERAGRQDLVICIFSGGGSSLMPMPINGVSIADKRKITEDLLKCGATIVEVNTVRKHLSKFKGGWLAKKAYPATVINLILSDVLGDPLDFIASGPTVPDSTTFNDAIRVLRKYSLWDSAPESVRKILMEGKRGNIPETPKKNDEAFNKVYNIIIGNNKLACTASCKTLQDEGLNTVLLTTSLEGEARHVGIVLAAIAREVTASGNPVKKPAGIVAGGETIVTVTGNGLGGRNQELALAAATKICGLDGVVIASLSTDGVDGPTNAAGAIVDGRTLTRSDKMGLKPEEFLANNNSYAFFSEVGDLILTGPTETNVNDISLIVVV
jgi:glycerate-2-kinase